MVCEVVFVGVDADSELVSNGLAVDWSGLHNVCTFGIHRIGKNGYH